MKRRRKIRPALSPNRWKEEPPRQSQRFPPRLRRARKGQKQHRWNLMRKSCVRLMKLHHSGTPQFKLSDRKDQTGIQKELTEQIVTHTGRTRWRLGFGGQGERCRCPKQQRFECRGTN